MDQNKRKALIGLAALLAVGMIAVVLFLSKGNGGEPSTPTAATPTQTAENKPTDPAGSEDVAPTKAPDFTGDEFVFTEDMNDIMFSHNGYFYNQGFTLKIFSRLSGDIRYTLDGTTPTRESEKYEDSGISMMAAIGDKPNTYPLRVKAFYDDGTESETYVHTYFVSTGVKSRYTTLVFSITGDPADLTEAPDGIFYGTNYKLKGQASERPIHLEVIDSNGDPILSQFAGVRIYGGASRESYQKSMKFFARKSYDENHGSFRLSCFDQLRLDGSNTQILNYDKFVLRNCGNDFQFAYVRDELNQTLAVMAGFSDFEAVLPAIAYRNGEYLGFYWLHSSYCDDFFQTKYGRNPALSENADPGEFFLLEGGDTYKKTDDDDEEKSSLAKDYEASYNDFTSRDVSNDAVYDELCKWMDVENYLDYFAYNIYLCNKDWPHNNYKCYRYLAGEGESYTEGTVFDGRWRYLLHDVDYTMGLYEQTEVKSSYDTLRDILNEHSPRFSPLLAQLLKRPECREYFVKRSLDYGNGALSYESVSETLDEINQNRKKEMEYYYDYLENLHQESIWTNRGHFDGFTQLIYDFAKKRPNRSLNFLRTNLELGADYTLEVTSSEEARIKVNGYTTKTGRNFTGKYFEDYETLVSAELPLGYCLDYWEVNGEKVSDATLRITPKDIVDGKVCVVLHTKKEELTTPLIYEFSSNQSDFVTLWNPTADAISLEGWLLSDGKQNFELPSGLSIPAGEYVTLYGNNYQGELPEGAVVFELGFSEGETVTLIHGADTICSVSVPKLHSGFVYRLDLYSGEYREVQ